MDDADIAALIGHVDDAEDADGLFGEEEYLFGEEVEEEGGAAAMPVKRESSSDDAVATITWKRKKKKKLSKRQRKRKRARILALSDDEVSSSGSEAHAPQPLKKRRRVLADSDDSDGMGFFAGEEAPPPMTPPDSDGGSDSLLTLDDILELGEGGGGGGGRRRFADDEAEEASDDDGGAKKQKAGVQASGDEVVIDVRAHEFVSAHPPTIVFRSGKTTATTVYVTLAGDLVRDMSCPLHTFRVRARRIPGSVASDTGEPVLGVLDIEKVIAGPVVDAGKSAMAEALKTNSAIVGDGQVRVTVQRLKRAISSSNFLKNIQNKAAYVSKLFDRLSKEFPRTEFLTPAALERFAPASGNTILSWMCRNALEDARFFDAVNKVGGAGVLAVGRPAPGTQPVWDAISGNDGAAKGIGGEGAVTDLLKKIHFANPLSEFRAARLHEALGVGASRDLRDITECIVRASAVVHSLPSPADVQDDRYRNAIVRSESHEVWPEGMLKLLRWHGLHVDKDDMQRWYACRQQTRQFYSTVVESMSAGAVRFIRAEVDDDHENASEDGNYIERVRSAVEEHKHNLLVISKAESRVRYLEYHTKGYNAKFMKFQIFYGGTYAPSENTVIWIDRAHTLHSRELTTLLTTWSPIAKAIYLAGSTWAGTTRYESTLFSQLFVGSSVEGRETLTTTLAEYKTAPPGSDPLVEGALGGVIPTIVGRLSAACPPAVTAVFPHARAYSIAQLAEAVDVRPRAMLVLYDSGWTREDLATVWQHAAPKRGVIWMLGGADWRSALLRSSRSNAMSAALMRKTAVVE